MADTKLTALSEVSVPTLDDLLYWVDDPAGTPVSNKASANRAGGLLNLGVCQGRLTTESGVPLSTSDRTAQGTIYFTPYNGSLITVYDGTRWKLYSFTERSLALTLTSGKPYDVFIYDNAGTLTLEVLVWTNDTTRATALTTQDGVLVKTGATTRRFLGTIYANGTNVTEDSAQNRLVSNAYNSVARPWRALTTVDSWSYASTTVRQADGNAANQVTAVFPRSGAAVRLSILVVISGASSEYHVGVGFDSLTAFDPVNLFPYLAPGGSGLIMTATAEYSSNVVTGFHTFAWLEAIAGGTVTIYGDNGLVPFGQIQSGITGEVWT